MSLKTPEKIRNFQKKIYLKAKAEPDFRFYQLYDKIYREDILQYAYRLAKTNGGSPGVDGKTFKMIESEGLEEWLTGVREELRTKTYKPKPVRRVMIPKPGGGERPLGIPTIKDRVVQTATKLVIEPIFEADLEPNTYAYRPKRRALDAVRKVEELLRKGYTDVVDADLTRYFDTIPHSELIKCVARRIVDRNVLHLIKLWLKSPVEEKDGNGKRRMSGGKKSTRGVPQGGVISPLLANLYINRFLKYWRVTDRRRAYWARIVSFADDFVILSNGRAEEALEWTRSVMERMGLELNEEKTVIRNARKEQFDFLGYTFGMVWFKKDGSRYLGASPSKKSIARVKKKVQKQLRPGEKRPWPEICKRLNALLRGWSAYFSHGTTQPAFRAVERSVYERVRLFLVHRHKVRSRGITRFPSERVFGEMGVFLPRPIRANRCVP